VKQVLSQRGLNRATLARQYLLERVPARAIGAIEHLAGMQAQAPLAPYLGLWTRVQDFTPKELSALTEQRHVVRLHLMRTTLTRLREVAERLPLRTFRTQEGDTLYGQPVNACHDFPLEVGQRKDGGALRRPRAGAVRAGGWSAWPAARCGYSGAGLGPGVWLGRAF